MLKKCIILAVLMGGETNLFAQTTSKANVVQLSQPQLTELQKTKFQLYLTQLNMIQQQAAPIQKSLQDLQAEIKKEYPGYTVDNNLNLVPIPKPEKVEPAKNTSPEVKK